MKVREIAELVGGEVSGDGDLEIESVADIRTATAGELAFYQGSDEVPPTSASCVIISSKLDSTHPCLIKAGNPKHAFAIAGKHLHKASLGKGRHETALIAAGADVQASFIGAHVTVGDGSIIGGGTEIGAGVRIGRNVVIGESTLVHPGVVIYDNVKIGAGCILHAGVVLGADGFGFVRGADGVYTKFPQIGTVVIEDDVEIGANTCVDRGALGETRIGKGTKIDNLVQIGHNVQIGKRCVIAAQTGISGSTVIEDDCVIGGQVGFGDHAHVKSGAIIGSQAGVLPGKIVRPGVWWGTPIQPLEEYKRQNAHVKSLERLKEQVKELKRKLDDSPDR
jgi:UDP-3-O-[3-hydroxymyristoyl] glucosamine N-acyltransferase